MRNVTLINVSGKCNFYLKYATRPSMVGGAFDNTEHCSENLSSSQEDSQTSLGKERESDIHREAQAYKTQA